MLALLWMQSLFLYFCLWYELCPDLTPKRSNTNKLTLKSLAILTFYMFAFDTFWKYEVWEKIWYADKISHFNFRLNPLITPPVEKSPIMTLSLQEVLIVGSCSEQVKFSELTLDMFRMLQSLEREPQEDMVQMYDASPAPGRIPYVRKEWLVTPPMFLFYFHYTNYEI